MTSPIQTAVSRFPAELTSLHAMLAWVRCRCTASAFTYRDVQHIEIALEEAFVNIIRHAYKNQSGVVEITCNYHPHVYIEIILKDDGRPFNPIEGHKVVDRLASLEERQIGGLGISLIEKLMDHIEYLRKGKTNILRLKKHCRT